MSLAVDTFRYFVHKDENWDYETFEVEADVTLAERVVGDTVDSIDPDIREFVSNGGKLLIYHGWADPGISPYNSVEYYRSVVDRIGSSAEESVQLFMVPGMGHCRGGEGPDTFDTIRVIDEWVENGDAPVASLPLGLVAAKWIVPARYALSQGLLSTMEPEVPTTNPILIVGSRNFGATDIRLVLAITSGAGPHPRKYELLDPPVDRIQRRDLRNVEVAYRVYVQMVEGAELAGRRPLAPEPVQDLERFAFKHHDPRLTPVADVQKALLRVVRESRAGGRRAVTTLRHEAFAANEHLRNVLPFGGEDLHPLSGTVGNVDKPVVGYLGRVHRRDELRRAGPLLLGGPRRVRLAIGRFVSERSPHSPEVPRVQRRKR